eukprot:CAMPEP_0205819008 /NCGR_PEP_ID=MMETSP0206-20130828/1165_1 /ASSEMBLY_ACC=CAM_ASM_000279 /TAXON_ID=36767 /ORGANISM="Euplotes focardii, Strain TN1" /LENGTH=99 /DNA_ID=CAMNT_0053112009 /DNA_START=66 /DNA_END=366 /DNA_ORIENTATION=+
MEAHRSCWAHWHLMGGNTSRRERHGVGADCSRWAHRDFMAWWHTKAKKATRAATAPIADVKTYLQGTVREELAKALLEMQRTKPDDPFGFLSNFFKRRN